MENEPILPPTTPLPSMPSPKAQSWGTLISIIIIILMVVIGAFYAWGKRITEENVPAIPTSNL